MQFLSVQEFCLFSKIVSVVYFTFFHIFIVTKDMCLFCNNFFGLCSIVYFKNTEITNFFNFYIKMIWSKLVIFVILAWHAVGEL